jgi:hypothetical protein
MRKFKNGDYIICEDNLFYVSKYLDLEGDFIFLTNSNIAHPIKNYPTEIHKHFITEDLKTNLILEGEKLGFEKVFFTMKGSSIYRDFKFATKRKLINILNR